jgi:UDP-N-acetylglucosamine acyltransferase
MRKIHSTAIVGTNVKLGQYCDIGPYVVIDGDVTIEDHVQIRSHSVIGTPAEKDGFWNHKFGKVVIGANTIISEFVTINGGTEGVTSVGKNCKILRSAHVGHDAVIADDVTLSCNSIVGGHAMVCRGSNLGLASVVHQRCIVGAYSLVGINGSVVKAHPVEPLGIYVGSPAKFLKKNTVGIERAKLVPSQIEMILEEYYKLTGTRPAPDSPLGPHHL